MKPIRIVVHGGPAAAHIADALHWLNGSQRASNLHHVSKLFGENEVYTEWIKEPADVREVPAAASSDPMLVSFIQNEVNKVFRARVACHGLDLPENVPPGVLRDMAYVLRQIMSDLPQNRDWLDPALEREATEILAKLNPAPVSPEAEGYFEKCRRETAGYHVAKGKPVSSDQPENHQATFYKEAVEHDNLTTLRELREAEALAKGWTREFIEGNGVDAELWVSPDKKVACYDLPETI